MSGRSSACALDGLRSSSAGMLPFRSLASHDVDSLWPADIASALVDLRALDLMINYYLINYSLIGSAGVRCLRSFCSLCLSASCAVLPSGSHLSGILVLFAPLTSLPSLKRLIGTLCLKGVMSIRWFPYSHPSS